MDELEFINNYDLPWKAPDMDDGHLSKLKMLAFQSERLTLKLLHNAKA
eukprot:CAMPEP_0168624934 /NCGR_PEP_ID=MMETSP0449_2-20121227/9707_1 /TAXON_ID=1082188 /ORGANISM="Strombidium rassoulzadegani, Strain ras09" /LENGTH=47 /DNA_ID= /DNA_START= /DNA_END= /DNA_ORIENTATION=